MLGGSVPGGYHQDVLSATPSDEASRSRLVEEIKSRAKGSIAAKNYPEAIQLYSKAIEVTTATPDAILHANRSMCYLAINNAQLALEDSEKAIELQPTYAKGFYRKGMAQLKLQDTSGAKESFTQGIALVPDDKDFRSQLDKLSSTPVISRATATTQAATSPPAARPVARAVTSGNTETAAVVVDDKDVDASAGNMRGYRRTTDGKMTTFFNNELDDETKALIGNIAPKKIDPTAAASVAAPATNGSVWNTAGTFEEVVHTPWATRRLKDLVSNIQISSVDPGDAPPPLDSVIVLTTTDITGDASVASNRGKRKHIYDFTVKCDWRLTVMEHSGSPEVLSGTIEMRDVTADRDYEFEVTVGSAPRPSVDGNKIITAFIKADGKGLKKRLVEACNVFYVEFTQR